MRNIALFLALFFSTNGFSQTLNVVDGNTTPYTPENLITNIFLGDGVTVTGVTFFGDPLSVGYFSDAEDAIGIGRGVVMSSGRVSSTQGGTGIDNPGSSFASYNSDTSVGDQDLNDIAGPGIPERDVCKYVISFIPTSDTLEFNYVFASEEYPEYSCSTFNDVFGFFISGPGIVGTQNIALIPGTATPVSINNIHPDNGPGCPPVNDQYYVDNNGSSAHPVYDGYTQVFTARAVVTPCEEYTIKLAISDAGDEIFDSGVFLEAKSFGTGTVDVNLQTVSVNGVLTESCSDGNIVFSLPNPPEEDTEIDVDIFGTAIAGVDYTALPNEFIIPAGETSLEIPISAFDDNLVEGQEFIGLSVQLDPCTRDSFYLYIKDYDLPGLDLGEDQVICELESLVLEGEIAVSLPDPPTFSNTTPVAIEPTNAIVTSSVDVFGVLPAVLQDGVIESVCINVEHKWLADLDIYLQGPSGLFMELVTDNGSNGDNYTQTCFVPGSVLDIDYINAPANAAPYTGEFNPEGPWSDLGFGTTNTNGEWSLLIIDDSEGFDGTLLDWNITFKPEYEIEYSWTPSTGLSCSDCPNPIASPTTTTEYILEATDSYGCYLTDTILVEVEPALSAPNVTCELTSPECILFSWDPVPGALSYLVNVDQSGFYIAPNGALSHEVCGINLNTTVEIEVVALDECSGFSGFASCTTPSCDGAIPVIEDIGGILCYGDDTGHIELEATGTFPPFEFTLNGETNTTGDFYNLPAGTYTVDIKDGVNCVENYDFTVPQPDTLLPVIQVDEPVSCFGLEDAVLSAQVNGGTGPMTYLWSIDNQMTQTAINIGDGLVAVEVTDSNGCVSDAAIDVEQPDQLGATPSSEFIFCAGASTGVATLSPVGGTQPYSFVWDGQASDSSSVVDIPAGTYTATITDDNGCESVQEVTVDEAEPIVLDFVSVNSGCGGGADGSITVNASGGLIDFFTYQWGPAAGNAFSQTVENLPAGTYSVTVTNAINCVVESTGIIETNADIITSSLIDPTSCWNSDDGAINVDVMGGTMPFTYEWDDIGLSTDERTNLSAGEYTLTITDADDCEEIMILEVPAPDSIEIQLVEVDPSCEGFSDGSAEVSAIGGTGVLSFDWGAGNTAAVYNGLSSGSYTVTVNDENGCLQTGDAILEDPEIYTSLLTQTDVSCYGLSDGSADLVPNPGSISDYTIEWFDGVTAFFRDDLAEGTYDYTIFNAQGCELSGTVDMQQPDSLSVSFTTVNDSCDGTDTGVIVANVSGGNIPYDYVWTNGNPGLSTITSLSAGTYEVTITDANDCELIADTLITSPEALSFDLDLQDADCFQGDEGTAAVNLITGTAPLTYEWSTTSTDPAISGLTAGTYTVTITDANDCVETLDFDINQPEEINAAFILTDPLCFDSSDGMAEVSAVNYGSTPAVINDFSFNWLNTGGQTGTSANGLNGVTYQVEITDLLGCVVTEEFILVNPPQMINTISVDQGVSCLNFADGALIANTILGTGPYSYQWGTFSNDQTTALATGLASGLHELTVTDANGCESTLSYDLEEPDGFDYSYSVQDVKCFGENTGSASLLVSGSNNSYSYDWGDGQTSAIATGLTAGDYEITVTDIEGCSFVAELTVNQPEALTAQVQVEDVSCFGAEDGTLTVTAEGGMPQYSFSLNSPSDTQSGTEFQLLSGGSYDVFVVDDNGCDIVIEDVEVNEPIAMYLNLGGTILLEDTDNFELEPELVFETPIASYNWELTGDGLVDCLDCPVLSVTEMNGQAFITLTVLDENGCKIEDQLTIVQRMESVVMVPTGFSPNGDGNNDLLFVHGSERLKVLSLSVYDRWSNCLFRGEGEYDLNDPTLSWDGSYKGKVAPTGAYMWVAEILHVDGRKEVFKGSVNLIR